MDLSVTCSFPYVAHSLSKPGKVGQSSGILITLEKNSHVVMSQVTANLHPADRSKGLMNSIYHFSRGAYPLITITMDTDTQQCLLGEESTDFEGN